MKKALIILVVFALALMALPPLWYYNHARQLEARVAEYQSWAGSQKPVPVEFIVTAPPHTPDDQTLYLSGSAPALGNWQAAGVPMQRRADGKYQATVELLSGIEHACKITRGNWATVEVGADEEELANHTFRLDVANPAPVELTVVQWRDKGAAVPGRITFSGDVRLHAKFRSDVLGNERTIWVYLPPGYNDETEARYPVLYMQDGQNLFNESDSFQGIEWQLDEAAQKLIGEGRIKPLIIVGIENGRELREEEFTPPAMASSSAKARGNDYARFIVEEVKPFIDRIYRTLPEPQDTAVGGSSMGGLITLFTVKLHPDSFGRIALLTPWLRASNKPISAAIGDDLAFLQGKRLYIEMGSAGGRNYPGDDPIADARAFVQKLQAAGQGGEQLNYDEIEGAEHNEAAWQKLSDAMLLWLFPAS